MCVSRGPVHVLECEWVRSACPPASQRASDTAPSSASRTPCVRDPCLLQGDSDENETTPTRLLTKGGNKVTKKRKDKLFLDSARALLHELQFKIIIIYFPAQVIQPCCTI